MIRNWIRIRIHWSETWIRGSRSGSGSTPKCHGSATLLKTGFFLHNLRRVWNLYRLPLKPTVHSMQGSLLSRTEACESSCVCGSANEHAVYRRVWLSPPWVQVAGSRLYLPAGAGWPACCAAARPGPPAAARPAPYRRTRTSAAVGRSGTRGNLAQRTGLI
jgi:hypothetical protein